MCVLYDFILLRLQFPSFAVVCVLIFFGLVNAVDLHLHIEYYVFPAA